MLGIQPGKWTPAVVISRFNGLLGNVDQELIDCVGDQGRSASSRSRTSCISNPPIRISKLIRPSTHRCFRTRSSLSITLFAPRFKFTADELLPEYRNPATVARLDCRLEASTASGDIRRRHRQQQLGGERKAHRQRISA